MSLTTTYYKYHLYNGRGPDAQFAAGTTAFGHGPVNGWYYGTAETDGNLPDLSNWQAVIITEEQYKEDLLTPAAIRARLVEIDIESVRPLRAIAEQTEVEFDLTKLEALEAEAVVLRGKL